MGKKQKRLKQKNSQVTKQSLNAFPNYKEPDIIIQQISPENRAKLDASDEKKNNKFETQIRGESQQLSSETNVNQYNVSFSPYNEKLATTVRTIKRRSNSAPKTYGQDRSTTDSETPDSCDEMYFQQNNFMDLNNLKSLLNARTLELLSNTQHDCDGKGLQELINQFEGLSEEDHNAEDLEIQRLKTALQHSNLLYAANNQHPILQSETLRNTILEQTKQKFDGQTLEILLDKVYFEGFTFDQVKEYLYPALQNVKDLNSFFDILFNVIKDYANEVRDHLLEKLKELLVKSASAEPKIQSANTHVLQGYSSYKQFEKNQPKYHNLIRKFYESYKTIGVLSHDADKISRIYLENFIEKSKMIKFNCDELHHKIFLSFVYNDPYIKHFLENMYILFEENETYARSNPVVANNIQELYESLYLDTETDPSKILLYEEDVKKETKEEISYFLGDEPDSFKTKETFETDFAYEEHKISKRYNRDKNVRLDSLEKCQYLEDAYDELIMDKKEAKKARKKNRKKNKGNKILTNREQTDLNENVKDMKIPASSEDTKPKGATEKENLSLNSNNLTTINYRSNKSAFDREIEDFERRLLNTEKIPVASKVKPNLSEDWLKNLKQRLQKTLNIVY